MSADEPTDSDRYPGLSEHGRQILERLKEHPHAPLFRNQSGHRLLPDEVANIRALEEKTLTARIDWRPGEPPSWMGEFVKSCLSNVPFYRAYGAQPTHFDALPTIDRGDLGEDIARFVPDEISLQRLINFQTSGTTGHPLLLPSHPIVAAQYLAHHKRALRRFGIVLKHGRDQVGVILLGLQSKCFTYVSVTPSMDESGLAKINLHPNDWREPSDRARYLEAMQAEVIAGDPISYVELLSIDPQIHPAALLSTSMALSRALRVELETRFKCPVLDVYSMNEAGPIAVWDEAAEGHVLLQPRMYVEIVDDNGDVLPEGKRGEIVLTGGFNFCLPLLRYRTGDFASLVRRGEDLVLSELAGRPPVRYRTAHDTWVNNIEITHALRPYPIRQFSVHQDSAGIVHIQYAAASVDDGVVREALADVLGAETSVRIERVANFTGKIVQYTSSYPGSSST